MIKKYHLLYATFVNKNTTILKKTTIGQLFAYVNMSPISIERLRKIYLPADRRWLR
jgi:hypothetical protein